MKHNYIGNACGTSVPVTTKQTKVLERGCALPAALDVSQKMNMAPFQMNR